MAAPPLKLVTVAGPNLSVHVHPLNTFNNNNSTGRSIKPNGGLYKPLVQLNTHLHQQNPIRQQEEQQQNDLPIRQTQSVTSQHHHQQQTLSTTTPTTHHVTFNLQPETRMESPEHLQKGEAPLVTNGDIPREDSALIMSSSSSSNSIVSGLSSRQKLSTTARRKMSVMHTDPLLVVQENASTSCNGFSTHPSSNNQHHNRLSVGQYPKSVCH